MEGATNLKSAHFTPLEMPFPMLSCFAEIKIFYFWPKPSAIVHGFDQICFRTQNSSMEGATKLKLPPVDILFCRNPTSVDRNQWTIVRDCDQISFCTRTCTSITGRCTKMYGLLIRTVHVFVLQMTCRSRLSGTLASRCPRPRSPWTSTSPPLRPSTSRPGWRHCDATSRNLKVSGHTVIVCIAAHIVAWGVDRALPLSVDI